MKSIDKLIQHANQSQMAFITASSENNNLTNDLKLTGLSFSKVKGTNLKDNSYAVYNTNMSKYSFTKLMIQLSAKYNQDSILITNFDISKDSNNKQFKVRQLYNTDVKAICYDKEGNIIMTLKEISLQDIENHYTKALGIKVKIESVKDLLDDSPNLYVNNCATACMASRNYNRALEKIIGDDDFVYLGFEKH